MDQELNVIVMPDGSLELEWAKAAEGPVDKSTGMLQQEIYNRHHEDNSSWLLFLGFCNKGVSLSPALNFWREVAGAFAQRLTMTQDIEDLRHKVLVPIEEDDLRRYLEDMPMMTGAEYMNREVIESVWQGLNRTFSSAIERYQGSVEEFIRAYSPDVHLVGRVFFHLVENKDGELPFAFLATYSTRLDLHGKSRHLPLRHALQEYGKDSQKLLDLLVTVHRAAGQSPFIAEILESGELFHPLALNAKDAFIFLKEIPVYEASGILCRIPNWWKSGAPAAMLDIRMGDSQPSYLGIKAILDISPRLLLGDVEITEEEARQLIEESEGLAFIKNRWVAADT
jgi:hypothetical protein